jgi:5-methylcytosine-specific restriction endonuclease McrA
MNEDDFKKDKTYTFDISFLIPPNRLINNRIDEKLKIDYRTDSLQELRNHLIDLESFIAEISEEHKKKIAEYEHKYILLCNKHNYCLIRKKEYDKYFWEFTHIICKAWDRLSLIKQLIVSCPKLSGYRDDLDIDISKYSFINENEKSRLNQLKDKLEELLRYYSFDRGSPPAPVSPEAYQNLDTTSIENRIAKLRSLIKKKERAEAGKAIITSYRKEIREISVVIKKQLEEQKNKFPNCPYCNGLLGKKPHCDHIHPVSHGGLSTIVNMVYICSSCNLKKKDFTLREFLSISSLNRDEVEERLLMMGKRI